MLSLLGYALMLVGSIKMLWFVFWLIMAWSAAASAQFTKQVGSSQNPTHGRIRLGKHIQNEAFQRFTVSSFLLIVGSLLYAGAT